MKKLFFILLVFFVQDLSAQNLSQTLRGKVIDQEGQYDLVGATVSINNLSKTQNAITDANGSFRFEKVPLGRVNLKVTYMGYEVKLLTNIELTSGKEVVLQIYMQETIQNLNEVIVKAQKVKGEVENEMALVSARQVTVDETQRYAGSFNDPARMVSSFAGVTSNVEGSNDIVVRGNSPKYIQWKLEGVEMPNPNHFGSVGGTGGPISALNSNLLANSDFYTGAFAPEYGNVLSGVFDVKFRKGNDEKREFTFGIGALGIDAAMEGPFKKGSSASYLFNYRYSSLALLNNLGLVDFGGVPKYQDMAFKIVLPSQKFGSFTLFGMGGVSGISNTNTDTLKRTFANGNEFKYKQLQDFKEKNNLFIVGLNHLFSFSNNFYLQSGLSYSGSSINELEDRSIDGKLYKADGKFLKDSLKAKFINYKAKYLNTSATAFIKFNYKLSNQHKIEAGTKYIATGNDYESFSLRYPDQKLITDLDFNKTIGMWRSFGSWKYRINENLTTVAGFHHVYLPILQQNSFEPRFSLRYQKPGNGAITFAYGKHSNMEQISNYYVKTNNNDNVKAEPNKKLTLLKADHLVLGYEKRLGDNHILKLETYYQRLYDLPVENDPKSYYSTINEVSDFRNKDLVSDGKGKNYGVEISIERFFSQNFYYLATASIYDSKYTAKDGIERNTLYNSNFALNFMVGKEFVNVSKKHNKTYGVNAKFFYIGARKIIPLLRNAEGKLAVDIDNDTYYDYTKAYQSGLDNVFQMNVSGSVKINKASLTHEIALDIINVNNSTARINEYYDTKKTGNINYTRPLALLPNIVYRVKF
jgi:hypothetical protein